jgi:hypothetical protein
MSDSRTLAIAAAVLGLACASAPPVEPASRPAPVAGRYARVEVALAQRGAPCLEADAAARLAAVVRQSARDWLEQRERLAPDGAYALAVTVDSARLRSAWVTWLFAWVAAPDHVAARVSVLRDGAPVAGYPVRVESALAGYSWRDPDARLDRLARRLGHRLAEGL